jgi:hypothetical protein
MILEQGSIYRSIPGQNEFSFEISLENSNISGISNIGFLGDSGSLNLFRFNSGQILDSNNRYVWSYNPRENIIISGNIGPGYLNYFINNKPVCLFSPHPERYYDNFYANTNKSILDFDLIVNGAIPEYQIFYPENILSNQNVTGYVKNISSPLERSLKIFSGSIVDLNFDYTLNTISTNTISGGRSGVFVLTPSAINNLTGAVLNTVNLTLNTNFGTFTQELNYSVFPAPIYFTDFITGYTGALGLIEDFTLEKFYNYELKSLYPIDRTVHVIVENFTGHSGQILSGEFVASGVVSGSFSKFIYGFDYITGRASGTGISIEDLDYYGKLPTGRIGENVSTLQFATGLIEYKYNLPIFGGSGTGFAPAGTIITGSGILTGNSNISGFLYGFGKFYTTGNIRLTGYYNEGINIRSGNQNIYFLTGFTGIFTNDYSELNWSAHLVSGRGILGTNPGFYYGPGDLILGITGVRAFEIGSGNNSGFLSLDTTALRGVQSTGIYLRPLIKPNPGLFVSSGIASSSENTSLANNIFTGNDYFYFTGATGWAVFDFTGYSPTDKTGITHVSFELDKNTLNIPKNIGVQVRTNAGFGNIFLGDLTSLNLYNSNIKYLQNTTNSVINSNNTYLQVRFIYTSTGIWPHQSTGNVELQRAVGIKNLQFYHGYAVNRVSGDSLVYNLNFNRMTGYSENSGAIDPTNFSGTVFSSQDTQEYPAWEAFNTNKSLYPYAQLLQDDNYNIFIGYQTAEPLRRNLTGFRIEFPSGADIPPYYSVEYSQDGETYYKSFVRTGNVQLIETGFFKVATDYQYFRVNLSPKDPCVYSPATGHPCYKTVIENDPFCCSALWSSGCQESFEICTGLIVPFSSPPIFALPPFTVNGWNILFYSNLQNQTNFTDPIQEYSVSSGTNIYSIKNTNNIFISTGSGNSGTFINSTPSGSITGSNFIKSSANGNKLAILLDSGFSADYNSVGRSNATMNFSVKTLGITSGEWSTTSGLYNQVYYDNLESSFILDSGQFKINDGNLILSAKNFDISNNGNYIIFYNYPYLNNNVIQGPDLNDNIRDGYLGLINNNTYSAYYNDFIDSELAPGGEYRSFSGLKITDNGFFAGFLARTLPDDIPNDNYLVTGRFINRNPFLNLQINKYTAAFLTGTGLNAASLLEISKTNGSCITVGIKSGRLISSRNSGISWSTGNGINTNFPWKKILISDSGRHQSAIFATGEVYNFSNNINPIYSGYGIYTSSGSGVSWNYITGGQLLVDYNISPNGRYVGFIHKNNLSSPGTLYTSKNFGITGSFSGSVLTETGLGLGNLNIQQVKVSNSGVYVVKYDKYLMRRTIL